MVEPGREVSTFASFAAILSPSDAERSVTVHASDGWSIDDAAMAGASDAVWGRLPAARQRASESVRHAMRREAALAKLRIKPPRGLFVTRVHRLPAAPHAGRLRNALRTLLLGGAAVELSSHRPVAPRVFDAVVRQSGVDPTSIGSLAAARDGSLRCHARQGERRVLLRAATRPSGKRPRRSARALAALAAAGIDLAPRGLGDGEVDGVEWTLESVEPGRIPARMSRSLWRQVVKFAISLRTSGNESSVEAQIVVVSARVPELGAPLRQLAAEAPIRDLPTVVQHGDLCRDNLLVVGDRLSAVIDWETWSSSGTPGVDLLELFATERMRATGEQSMDLWRAAIWADPRFLRLTDEYWSALGIVPDARVLRAVGVAWWVNQIASDVQRPERAYLLDNPAWIGRRVADTAAAFGRGAGLQGSFPADRSRAPGSGPAAPHEYHEHDDSRDDGA